LRAAAEGQRYAASANANIHFITHGLRGENMSIRVYAEPMPDNPAKNIGDKTGLWRVIIESGGERDIHKENLPYPEAFKLASDPQRKYDARE
jgi:hypothetical protein